MWYFHRIPARLYSQFPIIPKIIINEISFLLNPPHKFRIDFDPDIIDAVIVMDPTWCNFELGRFKNAITAYWSWDNVYKTSLIHDLILTDLDKFDYVFSAHKGTLDYFSSAGTKAIWMPFYYDSDINFPMELAKNYDVSFVGNIYGDRKDYISHMKKRLGHLKYFYGNSYQKDQNKIYNESKIVLNFPNVRELNFRVFEALGSGSFLLNGQSYETMELFEDNKDIVFFDDMNDLTEKIEFYLESENERKRISSSGHRKVYEYHTLDRRVKSILQTLGLLWNSDQLKI